MSLTSQLTLPLLEALQDAGGAAPMRSIYDTVAERVGASAEVRSERRPFPGRPGSTLNVFEHRVRSALQSVKRLGLAERRADEACWALTGKGRDKLHVVRPGLVLTFFVADDGAFLVGDATDALGYVDDGSAQCLLTSPPYPLLRKKDYGNETEDAWVDWFIRIAERWPDKLTPNGSVVLNLADVWMPGSPTLSLYQERLLQRLASDVGLRLAERHAWLNPAKMPAPAEWVTVRRIRVKPAAEQVYVLSRDGHHYADNRQILEPYSQSMRARLAAGGERGAHRPSGYQLSANSFSTDAGGSIPHNVLIAANTASNDAYIRACRAEGLPIHPARFPAALPERFIKYLTKPGDLVVDPFAGSGTTLAVAQSLGRRWIGIDRVREYATGAALRLAAAPGFAMAA